MLLSSHGTMRIFCNIQTPVDFSMRRSEERREEVELASLLEVSRPAIKTRSTFTRRRVVLNAFTFLHQAMQH